MNENYYYAEMYNLSIDLIQGEFFTSGILSFEDKLAFSITNSKYRKALYNDTQKLTTYKFF